MLHPRTNFFPSPFSLPPNEDTPGSQNRRTPAAGGFTLVEVVLAIGIIALAFVPVLGLLPVGAEVARQAIDTTVEAQINQQLVNQAQQTDFSMIDSLATSGPFYFDYQGNETSEADAIYEAGYVVTRNTILPKDIDTSRLARVTICILNAKARATSQASLADNPSAKKFAVLVPDNGR